MPLDKGGLHERGGKRGTPPKKLYSAVIGSSNMKMVANRHRHAA